MLAKEEEMPRELLLDPQKIIFRQIVGTDWECTKNFRCKNGSMDAFLNMEAYEKHIWREASTTLVFYENDLAGYYTLQRNEIKITEPISELVTQDALALARLAVDSKFQSKGLGTYILREMIIKNAYAANEMYIITDAVYEKWEWYQSIGFKSLVESEVDPEKPNEVVYMVFELMDEKLIEEYCNEDL